MDDIFGSLNYNGNVVFCDCIRLLLLFLCLVDMNLIFYNFLVIGFGFLVLYKLKIYL